MKRFIQPVRFVRRDLEFHVVAVDGEMAQVRGVVSGITSWVRLAAIAPYLPAPHGIDVAAWERETHRRLEGVK